MAFTGKQARNGADITVPTANPAQPGPDYSGTISGLQARAQSIGHYRAQGQFEEGITVTPFGTGISTNGSYGGSDMWEWDDGLAVAEQPGEP